MATFLDSVNDVMVLEGIISGDDDEITGFDDTQHVASIRLAKKAIQQELALLTADEFIPFERASALLTVAARTADLASDFVRFQDSHPVMLETDSGGATQGGYIYEFRGGETKLRLTDPHYYTTPGKPTHFYWQGGTAKTVGVWPVPSTNYYFRYFYEKDVEVTLEADTIPLGTSTEVHVFNQAAARRFKYLRSSPRIREVMFSNGLANDDVIQSARATLLRLLAHKPASKRYGRVHL